MNVAMSGHCAQPDHLGIVIFRLRHLATGRAGQLRKSIVLVLTSTAGFQ